MPTVRIDGARLVDWPSFHDVFASTFGFPAFDGRNMNAWIDCTAFVNWRRMETGDAAILVLSYWRTEPSR